MNINPDPTKQAQELIFSREVQTINHPPLFFNQNVVQQTSLQKDLGMYLKSKLNFSEHLKTIFQKNNKTIRDTSRTLNFSSQFLSKPHLAYGETIYDQTFNMPFQQKMEITQYSATLAITSAIRGFSRERLHQELGLETLQKRRCYREQSPKYLYSIIPIHSL